MPLAVQDPDKIVTDLAVTTTSRRSPTPRPVEPGAQGSSSSPNLQVLTTALRSPVHDRRNHGIEQ